MSPQPAATPPDSPSVQAADVKIDVHSSPWSGAPDGAGKKWRVAWAGGIYARQEANLDAPKTKLLEPGDIVTQLQQATVDSVLWVRSEAGWLPVTVGPHVGLVLADSAAAAAAAAVAAT